MKPTAVLLAAGLLAVAIGYIGCSVDREPATVESATVKTTSVQSAPVERAPEKTATVKCVPEKTVIGERVVGGPNNAAVAERSVQVPRLTLVDSTEEGEPGDLSVTLYSVQVATGSRIDTIPRVRTTKLPTVGADGNVYVFGYDEGGFMTGAYRYDPNTRKLAKLQLPPGVRMLETHMAISPDARHIAYISTESCASGVVRSWPDGKLIAQTPANPWFASDNDYNDVRWLDANRAEIVYRTGPPPEPGSDWSRGLWIHAVVAVDMRDVKLDSLASKPDWKH